MLRLCSDITIEGEKIWQFYTVASCQIIEDISTLTDTCELQLPKKIKWQEAVYNNGKPPVKRGDKITVRLGYDDDLQVRFTGYVRSVDAKVPITIKCEDGMFLLKTQKAKPKAFKNALLKDVIAHLLEGTKIKFKLIDEDLKIGNWRITKPTVADELQELKEKQMLSSYFRTINGESILYVGLAYPFDNRKKIKFEHSKNIISEEFEYRDKEDIRAKVEAVTFNKKHKKTTIEIGDKDGEVIKIRIDGLTENELKKYAQQALDRYKQTGFKGSFETFGQPEVSKCDMVDILASDGNQGVYLVKKNEISFGTGGYRQKIELGQPISQKPSKGR
ncbi:MAG: hypothetical protein KBA33_08080 [Cloacibacterium sp.]|nr:hypothetical protein [Cloacibacterium sp.]